MRQLWEGSAREELIERIRKLTPERPPLWGKLNAPRMLAHVSDQIRMALGDVPARKGSGPLSVWPVNYLMIHVVPWPHGATGPLEAFTTKPATWDADLEHLVTLIGRFCDCRQQTSWPEHPMFGKLSGKDWAALSYKHLTHHLRQFAV
ncbi:MAG: DUF1569 domain-containing protein [Thermoanaerobaculia bacterium]